MAMLQGAVLEERVEFDAYGRARHYWASDVDGDGAVTQGDQNAITAAANANPQLQIGASGYNVAMDINRDGVIDLLDVFAFVAQANRPALAVGQISDPAGPDNLIGYDGYVFNMENTLYTVRFRNYDPQLGRWVERDPLEYVDGSNLYQYVNSSPTQHIDFIGSFTSGPDLNNISLFAPPAKLQGCNLSSCYSACDKLTPLYIHQINRLFCYKHCQAKKDNFIKWYNKERNISWTNLLPDCPCNINNNCVPDPTVWNAQDTFLHGYHKGAKSCMRSKAVWGHANQCCYDTDGKLITHGSGSGSADKTPGTVLSFFEHKRDDMDPADKAKQLDGGGWGCWSEMYLLVRPQIWSNKCPKNP